MWKNKAVSLLSAVLCCSVLSIGASADGYFASDENGTVTPPAAIDSITVSTEDIDPNISQPEIEWDENAEEITEEIGDFMSGFLDLFGGTALTPNGNLTLVDDILQDESYYVSGEKVVQDKQFITVQSKNGNYFYIVIDRSGDKENVYFLNMVDEADLMALIETVSEEPEAEPQEVCDCTEKCTVGDIKTECPVCAVKMADCTGKEIVVTPAKPADDPEKQNNESTLITLLLLALAGGGAVYYFKFRKPETNSSGNADLDDYPFADEEDSDNLDDVEYETEEDDTEK